MPAARRAMNPREKPRHCVPGIGVGLTNPRQKPRHCVPGNGVGLTNARQKPRHCVPGIGGEPRAQARPVPSLLPFDAIHVPQRNDPVAGGGQRLAVWTER